MCVCTALFQMASSERNESSMILPSAAHMAQMSESEWRLHCELEAASSIRAAHWLIKDCPPTSFTLIIPIKQLIQMQQQRGESELKGDGDGDEDEEEWNDEKVNEEDNTMREMMKLQLDNESQYDNQQILQQQPPQQTQRTEQGKSYIQLVQLGNWQEGQMSGSHSVYVLLAVQLLPVMNNSSPCYTHLHLLSLDLSHHCWLLTPIYGTFTQQINGLIVTQQQAFAVVNTDVRGRYTCIISMQLCMVHQSKYCEPSHMYMLILIWLYVCFSIK